ncbi:MULTISPECIES: ABC transporter permease [Micrococcaceae]|uniref:ABC transporter permease n=1 Tax=unclassified Kocuria TaxID=2649579 RepID=UPI0013EC261C|nr:MULTISPECIES: ABC transporter permease [unclassified Kocuria]
MKPFLLQFRNQSLGFVREPVASVFNLVVPFVIVMVQALAFGDEIIGDELPGYRVVDTLGVNAGVIFTMIVGLFGMGVGLASMIESRVLAGSSLRPGGPGLMMGAYAAVLLLMVLLGWTVSYLALKLGWQVKLPVAPLAALGVAALGVALFLALGVCIAALAGTPRGSQAICSVIFFPFLFLSGVLFPTTSFPQILREIAAWLPGYRLTEALAPFWIEGQDIDSGSVLYLAVVLVLAVILARVLMRRREDV